MTTLQALIPPVAALVLLFRLRAPIAAPTVLVITVVTAIVGFQATAATLRHAAWDAVPVTLEVLLIIFGGLWLSTLLSHFGATDTLATWLTDMGISVERMVVLVVLGVTPFAEAVTGFGVGAIIAIPILLAVGLPPVPAAVCGLLGFVAVPWGALAPGTLVGARLGHVDFQDLGVMSAALSLPTFLVCGIGALVVAFGARRAAQRVVDLGAVALGLWLSIWTANYLLGTPLAGAAGAGLTIVGYVAAVSRIEHIGLHFPSSMRRAVSPYMLLCGLVILGRISQHLLLADAPGWLAGAFESPATWLIATCLAMPWLLGAGASERGNVWSCLARALTRWGPVAVATASFLAIGSLMATTGMSSALGQAASKLGPGYLAAAPVIGAVGGFLTGSNSGANAMFAASQAQAGHVLGLSPTFLVATNNVAGSMATMSSAPRVALAAGLLAAQVPATDAASERGGGGLNTDRRIFRTTLSVVTVTTAVYVLICPLIGLTFF